MGVGEITHTRVPYNTLKVTNALGKVCVIRDGLHHLQSCAIRSLAAHLEKTLRYISVPYTNVRRSKERLHKYECFNLATSNRKTDCWIQSLAPKTVPRLSTPAAHEAILPRHMSFTSERIQERKTQIPESNPRLQYFRGKF